MPTPILKVAQKCFRLIKLLMYKTKITSVQTNETFQEPILLQLLVEPDQNSKVHHLSMINLTLCIVLKLENSC